MLVLRRLQTLIGREIDVYELRLLADILNLSGDFFFHEESTIPPEVLQPACKVESEDGEDLSNKGQPSYAPEYRESPDRLNLGSKIREVRKSRGITAKHVLGKLNKKSGWLTRRENGEVDITVKELIQIANAMEINCSDLLQF